MCEPHDCPMVYRYMRRKKGHFLLLVISLAALYIWTDSYDSYTDYGGDEQQFNCKFPCIGHYCVYCRTQEQTTVKTVDIAEHLNLKQVLRVSRSESRKNVSSTEQVCKRPNFDLKHDSVKYAFFNLPPLNCSKEELFHLEGNVFKFNKTQLGDRELDKCKYYGVERVSDDFSSYTDPLTKEKEPFDLILMHDFVRIKCFLKKDKEKSGAEDKDIKFENESEERNRKIENDMKVREEDVKLEENVNNSKSAEPNQNDTNVDVQDVYHGRLLQDYPNSAAVDTENETYRDDYDHYWNKFLDEDFFEREEPADFDQLFVQINPKKEVFDRIASKKQNRLKQRKLNVLMFGLDSMSHLSYQRKLPKTYRYLMELGAVVMDGYNIVGDATTAAIIPMLTGDSF